MVDVARERESVDSGRGVERTKKVSEKQERTPKYLREMRFQTIRVNVFSCKLFLAGAGYFPKSIKIRVTFRKREELRKPAFG